MWSLEWPESGSAAAHYVCAPSPTSGVFNITDTKHKPPDLELDPELLRTLNLPQRTSVDSLESESDAAIMDNWQMNEVFQDISSILNETTEEPAVNCDHSDDVERIVKEIFDNEPIDIETSGDFEMSAADTSIDLSWIIKETLGADVLPSEQPLELPSAHLDDNLHLEYDLLSQLEAMDDHTSGNTAVAVLDETPAVSPGACSSSSAASISSSPRSSVSDSDDSISIVAIDHQYTQLASVRAKPHETKKEAIRRVKNNAASRVCRRQRKNRLISNIDKVAELTATNNELLQQIRDVESIVCLLKDHLVKATSKK